MPKQINAAHSSLRQQVSLINRQHPSILNLWSLTSCPEIDVGIRPSVEDPRIAIPNGTCHVTQTSPVAPERLLPPSLLLSILPRLEWQQQQPPSLPFSLESVAQ